MRSADLAAARIALDRDENDKAIQIAEQALKEDRANPEAWIILGHGLSAEVDSFGTFKKMSTARRILAAYSEAAKLAPQNTEVHASLLEFYLRAPAIVGGSTAKAWEEERRLRELDSALAFRWAIELDLDEGKMDSAVEAWNELHRLEPNSFRTVYWLARIKQQAGDNASAISAFRDALKLTPGPRDPDLDEVQVALGELLERDQQPEAARAAYSAALAINPRSTEAKAHLASMPAAAASSKK
ncbi:MAG TPA: tetratricopeptide repeat protein [Opitutaceae bacterium]